MKKLTRLVLVLAVLFSFALTGCSGDDKDAANSTNTEAGADTADKAEDADAADQASKDNADQAADESGRKTFTVGFDANFPPYGYLDEDGNYVGFDLDLAQVVADRNGWELVKQPIDWDSKDMELSAGSIDCIWNGFTMQGREEDYEWTEPYVDNSQVFVVAKDSGISSQADLAGKVVLVQADSSALKALNGEEQAELKATFAEMTEIPDYNTAFMNLEAGSGDAVAMDIGVAKYQIESRGDEFVILEDYLASEQYGIGFLLGNTSLRDTVQKTLEEMYEDGTFTKISDAWDLTDTVCFGK